MTDKSFGVSLLLVLVFLVVAVGWALNLFHLATGAMNFTPESNLAMLMLRAVGVFVFPVGGFLGLFF